MERGRRRPVLDRETGGAVIAGLRDDAARTPRYLSDRISPEMLDDLVERAGNGRQGRKPLDHRVAAANRLAIDDGIALLIMDRPGREIAFAVGERLIELHRKAVL